MSEKAATKTVNGTITSAPTAQLWQPVLMRSMITLLFGIITVFLGSPEVLALCLNLTWYFLALAATHYWFVKRLQLPLRDPRKMVLLSGAGLLAVSGVVVFISTSSLVAAWLGAIALLVMGAAELFAAIRSEGKTQLRSDWLISGVIGIGTGLLLPFFADLGPHALLGVAGGGALMSGALWLLSALSLRHESRKAKTA